MLRGRDDLHIVLKPDGFHLSHDVVSANGRRLWTLPLISLLGSEENNLHGGRFEAFTPERQEHRFHVRWRGSGPDFQFWFAQRVEWIASFTASPWSFDVEVRHMQEIGVAFTFADAAVAVAFALVWGEG